MNTLLHDISKVGAFSLAILFSASLIYAQEHPKEHPAENPGSAAKLTVDELAAAIEGYVKSETELKGGYFLVYDEVGKKPLVLSLDKVHKEKLATLGNGVFFACADFKTPEGKVYDLDVFMKGPNKDELMVTEITVHKESGKARYGWYEEGGIWKKK